MILVFTGSSRFATYRGVPQYVGLGHERGPEPLENNT
jgi:hypothetical protein